MTNSRIFYKQGGTWKPQATQGFFHKVDGEWKNVSNAYKKESGSWHEVFDEAIADDFESTLQNNGTFTAAGSGTLRITVRGFSARGGDGARGGENGPGRRTKRLFFVSQPVYGGYGGGGGGGGRATGALAISDVEVVGGDEITRTDNSTHVRIFLNGNLVASAEGAKDGDNAPTTPKQNRGGGGGFGGAGGKGATGGRASASVGNVRKENGADGADGKKGGNGTSGTFTAFGRRFGTSGKGGAGNPNSGKSGNGYVRAFGAAWAMLTDTPVNHPGAGGSGGGYSASKRRNASVQIEAL